MNVKMEHWWNEAIHGKAEVLREETVKSAICILLWDLWWTKQYPEF